jgi:hypothetical protein
VADRSLSECSETNWTERKVAAGRNSEVNTNADKDSFSVTAFGEKGHSFLFPVQSKNPSGSQKSAAKDHGRQIEVNNQPRDIDQGSNEGGGGAGGVEAEAAEDEGQHGTGYCPESDDTD